MDLGSDAAKNCSVAVLSMSKLQTLGFHNVKLDSQFFTVLIDMQHESQVRHYNWNNLILTFTGHEIIITKELL